MPDWRTEVRSRLPKLGLAAGDEADVVEEIAQHLEQQFAELCVHVGSDEARRQLLAQLDDPAFGTIPVRRRRAATRRSTRLLNLHWLGRDARYGARTLTRSPAVMLIAALALALGIGLTTMMYSVVYGLIIKGLPYDDPDRIAFVMEASPSRSVDDQTQTSVQDFAEFQAQQRAFESLGGYDLGPVTVSAPGLPERIEVAWMTRGVFDVTRVRPLLGRTFRAGEDTVGGPPVAVLSYAAWRDRFGADSSAIGQSIRVDGKPVTVVGVMPPRFAFPHENVRIWLPLQLDPVGTPRGQGRGLSVVGRLRSGVSLEDAERELDVISSRIAAEHPETNAGVHAVVTSFQRAVMPPPVFSLLYTMLGAVTLVLLIACANVANLLLDRAAHRTREIGIRRALGASKLAVVRQFLLEAFMLSLVATLLGTALAQGGIVAFNHAIADTQPPFWMDVRLHPQVLLFAAAMGLLATVASGLLPAVQSARIDINEILKDDSRAASSLSIGRLSRTLVVFEIALSCTLLIAAGLMTKSVVRLRAITPGFVTKNILTAQVSYSSTDPAKQQHFFETLAHEIARLPGAQAASLSTQLPGGLPYPSRFAIEGHTYAREQDYPMSQQAAVTPGYFETFDIPVLRGRAIEATDRMGTVPVAVVNQRFVDEYFHGADPLGKRIRLGGASSTRPWLTIVGVIPTLYTSTTPTHRDSWPPALLTSYWQRPRSDASIAIRSTSDPMALVPAVRRIVATLDADVPVSRVSSMDALMAQSMWAMRVFGGLFVVFGLVALTLAAIGLYAVMAFSVSRRVREMGVRIALGATNGDVVRLVCRQGARQIAIGLLLGLAAGAAAARLLTVVLFEVQPHDPFVFAIVVLVLSASGLVACLIPAARATRVDPVTALRSE
ncbi:MAG TPA: ABC transporter permease [Gemmatimonadaceae bacterium]|nr:ABC transporter permease [Gemmatimonadaceae bacterium]